MKKTGMKKAVEIYKRLHGEHICKQPGCNTVVMGTFCLEHIERAIAQHWEEIDADEPQQQEKKP